MLEKEWIEREREDVERKQKRDSSNERIKGRVAILMQFSSCFSLNVQ